MISDRTDPKKDEIPDHGFQTVISFFSLMVERLDLSFLQWPSAHQ